MNRSFIIFATGLLLAGPLVLADDNFGRLFTDPAERALLDQLRHGQQAIRTPTDIESSPKHLSLDGIVLHDGVTTQIWLNGQTLLRDAKTDKDLVLSSHDAEQNRYLVHLPHMKQAIELKPGQILDFTSGMIMEAYTIPLQSSDKDADQ